MDRAPKLKCGARVPDPKRKSKRKSKGANEDNSAVSQHRELNLIYREESAERAFHMEMKAGEQKIESMRQAAVAELETQRLANHMKNEHDRRIIEQVSMEDKRLMKANAEALLRNQEEALADRLRKEESEVRAEATAYIAKAEVNLKSRVENEMKRQAEDLEERAHAQIRLQEDNIRRQAEVFEAKLAEDAENHLRASAAAQSAEYSEHSKQHSSMAQNQAF